MSLERAALHWVRGHELLLEDLGHLDRALRLSYEAFCASPEAELERIRAFLGLETPFDAAAAREPVPAPTLDGRARPIADQNAASLGRLSAADVETVTRIAGPMMERLGYRPPG